MAREIGSPGGGATYWRFLPIGAVIAALGTGYALGLERYLSLDYLSARQAEIVAFVAPNFALSLAAYMVLYALAVAASFPATWVLTAFGGLVFGWLIGGAGASVGATLGATALFWAARTAFGGFLRKRVGGLAARDWLRASKKMHLGTFWHFDSFPSCHFSSPISRRPSSRCGSVHSWPLASLESCPACLFMPILAKV